MKYKRKGEQRVVVQHVNVNEGGKAMVGNFQTGVMEAKKIDEVPHDSRVRSQDQSVSYVNSL